MKRINDRLNALPFFVVVPLMMAVNAAFILVGSFVMSFPVGWLDYIAHRYPDSWGVLIGLSSLAGILLGCGFRFGLSRRKTYFELQQQTRQ